ncbi:MULTISPECIES: hypothetical protein [Moorena]|uniref:hypothetical protein n=1 Tax=Moorena TaxID=1155738 RepID=UPI0018E9E925|nr:MULTISPECIES: hypothetical protein [Moorena]
MESAIYVSIQLSAISHQLSVISEQRLALRARYANSFGSMATLLEVRTAFE